MTAPHTVCPLCGQPFASHETAVGHLVGGVAHSASEVAGALLLAVTAQRPTSTEPCRSQPFPTEHAAITHALAEASQVRRAYLHRRCGRWHLTRRPATERTPS